MNNLYMKIKEIIKEFVFILALIFLTPFFIIGGLLLILGRLITALRFIFWLEPKKFVIEVKEILKNNH